MRKNVASQVIGAQMITAADGSAFTGAVTCYVTGDGGTQAQGSVGAGACTHEGNGFHTYAPAQAETNYNHVAFTFVASGAIPVTVQIYTTSLNPHDTVRAGLTALPNAAAEAAGGLYTRGSGAGQINQQANGQIDANVERLANAAQSLTDLKDFADTGYDPAEHKVQGVVLTDTVTTYTGNTPQTGDAFARLGAPVGASISADVAGVKSDTAAILIDTADMQPKLGAPAGASISADIAAIQAKTDLIPADPADASDIAASFGAIAGALTTIDDLLDTEVAAIKAKTDLIPATPAAAGDAMALTSGERTTLADAILARALAAESYAADGAVPTLSQILYMIWSAIGDFSITGTTLTCKKLDGATTSMTFTLDSATAPTSRTRAS